MVMPTNESVTYDIRLEASKALIALADLTNATRSFTDQLAFAKMQIQSFANDTGMSFNQAKKTLAGLDAELSGTTGSSVIFGAKGQEAWNKVGTSAEQAGQKVTKSTQSMAGGINVVKVALYSLVSMGVFAVINAFQSLFSMAISGLREMETATYNLVNAERLLSEQGIEITPEGLDESIKKLQAIDPLLSKIQATELVSRISTNVAPQVGFTKEEIDQLAQSVAVLSVQNKGLGYSFEEVEKQMTDAFLTGKVSQGINRLGVKINDQIVRDEAVRMGLVKTADEFDNLTGKIEAQVKARAMLSIISQTTNKSIEHLPDFLKTADAQFALFQARLQDLLTILGKDFGPLISQGFRMLTNAIEITIVVLEKLKPLIVGVVSLLVGLSAGRKDQGLFGFDKDAYQSAVADVANSFKEIGQLSDTPTGQLVPDISGQAKKEAEETRDVMAEVQDIMQDNEDKLIDLAQDYQNKIEDISKEHRRKTADLARERVRDLEDAERDYQQTIADIEQESAESQQEARLEYQRSEEEAEREHQDKLAELREKYLMDLEDALHERDARQILRLMRQYQIDRNNAVQERQQERQDNQVELQQTLQDLEIEKQEKLRKAREELEEKRAEIELNYKRERRDAAIAYSRSLADARIAHNRALAEQQEYLQRKLRDLATALQAEYNMTATQANALVQLMASTYDTLSGMGYSPTSGISVNSNGTLNTSAAQIGSTASAYSPSSINAGTYIPGGGLAEGGSFLATTPTSINVAENRPELITATPLGRPGRDVGKLFSNMAEGGMGGSMEIALTLSPDLEARIVRNSMDATANAIVRINRSKVR